MRSPQPALRNAAGFRTDLVRWRQLVCADWLAALVRGKRVAAPPLGPWQLFEVGCDARAAYASGHLPGARFLDTLLFEEPPYWNKVPDPELNGLLQGLGLRPDSTVILYARNTLAAARVAHLMLYAGMQDVRLLDGGLQAWCLAGHALQTGTQTAQAAPLPAASAPGVLQAWSHAALARPDYLVDLEQARALLNRHDAALVSLRSRAESMGDIAGAIWGDAGLDRDAQRMASFQDAQGCMLPAADIARVWLDAGLHPGMQMAFYCGTGWRAAQAFFYAWLMGWQRISLFDGGWFEWSADPANPVVRRA